MSETESAAVCCSLLHQSFLGFLQADVSGLDARMMALAQQQGQLQAALNRKQGLAEQLTKVMHVQADHQTAPFPGQNTVLLLCAANAATASSSPP